MSVSVSVSVSISASMSVSLSLSVSVSVLQCVAKNSNTLGPLVLGWVFLHV